MRLFHNVIWIAVILGAVVGCGSKNGQSSSKSSITKVQPASSKETRIDVFNEAGFAKISLREGDSYQEGIVDAQGSEVVQPNSKVLVNDITGSLALVQFERKFLFVPLDHGFVSTDDLDGVNGFHYAEPRQCGLALVSVNDTWFYIDTNFKRAFNAEYEFAESFHHDRALVKAGGRYQIIDTQDNPVADLKYDQVNPQSPWCWQVTMIKDGKYLSGFVNLDGKQIVELIYDYVGYYDPAVRRIPVAMNDRHGFVDEHARIVVPVKYEYAEVFDRGKAKVVLDGRAFFINPDGVEVPE